MLLTCLGRARASTMHVAFDFTGPARQNIGSAGGGTYPLYMLPRWARLGDRLTVIFSGGQVPDEVRAVGEVRELPSRTGRPPLDRIVDLNMGVAGVLRDARPDVAYFPGNFIGYGHPESVPKVVAVRSTLYFHYPSQGRALRVRLQRQAARHSARVAKRIIVPSSETASDLMRFAGAKTRQLVVIPHGVDLDVFQPGDTPAHGPLPFLFVSTPRDYKGLATVFRAMRELAKKGEDDSRLVVADGGIPAAEREGWLELARRLGIEARVSFAGRVHHAELGALYREAAALVLPSAHESFGNPFVEAAACGCPVISGRGSGIDDMVAPGTLQLPPHDHLRLADAMRSVLRWGSERRSEAFERGRRWAEGFSWERTVELTREVLVEASGAETG